MQLFEYPVTRPVVLGRWATVAIIFGWVVWMVLITLVNVVAVGYEYVTVSSTNFNSTERNWYEKIVHSNTLVSWNCSSSVVKLNEVVFSSPGIIAYTLLGYNDIQDGLVVDGLAYSNTAIDNCAVVVIGLVQFGSEAVQQSAFITCNTTSGQNILLQAERVGAGQDTTNFDAFPLNLQSIGPNTNWAILNQYWLGIADNLLNIIAEPGLTFPLLPSLVSNNLTSLRLEFFGNSDTMPMPNTPAADFWIMYVAYTQDNSFLETRIPIAFLPSGEIDMTHTDPSDLTMANTLLAPSTQLTQELLHDDTFDLLTAFGWILVTYYWGLLADLGQLAPVAYNVTTYPATPVPFPSTNNIFLNDTLFQSYFAYFNSTLNPILQQSYGPMAIPPPLLLNNETRLTPTQTTLLRSYTCLLRRIKDPLNLIISVAVAEYALLVGFYTFVHLVTGWLQKRKDDAREKMTGRSTGETSLGTEIQLGGLIVSEVK